MEILLAIFPYHVRDDPNSPCAYRVGHKGHSTEDCWSFKVKVQELIDQKVLSFFEEGPNVITNPLPDHY